MRSVPAPPRLAGWIIRRMFPDPGGSSVLGDMIETYRVLAADKGVLAAKAWFWVQCLKAIPCLVTEALYWRLPMFKNYLLVTVRNLKKNNTFSFLNTLSLAVGMAAFLLIALYVRFELSFDKYHENADRIYRVIREGRAFTPPPLGPALKANFPEVVASARILRSAKTLLSREQASFLEDEFYWADPATFEVFTIPFLSGDPKTALNDPAAIVLSQRAARKYFGHADPMGKTLTMSERHEFRVAGIMADMPANSHFVMDAVVPYEAYFRITGNDIASWRANFSYTYILLREGADADALDAKIAPAIEAPLLKAAGVKEPYPRFYYLQPMIQIHLRSHLMQEIGPNNDMKSILLFSSIAFLILFIACVNYMNLATARSVRRGREVGMRKVVGAQKAQLVAQFLSESVALAALAMVFSTVMVLAALPAFNSLVERRLRFNPLRDPLFFAGLVLVTVLVGLLAGSYPALRMSGFKPISVLRGAFARSSEGTALRNVLVLVQFSITIALIVCTIAVREQMRFIRTADMGYAREQIITVPVRGESIHRNIEAIKTELMRYPDISAVTTSARLPNDIDTFTSRDWTGRNPDEPIPIYYNTADYDFVDVFGVQIVRGRNFSRDFPSDQKGAFLVNEAAVRVAGWGSPIGRKLTHWRGDTGEIVGVIKDFHLRSLHHPIEPLYIFLDPGDFANISVKIKSTGIPSTIEHLKRVMTKYSSSYPFTYSFFDDVFERAYFAEQRLGRVFGSFAVLAVFVACLGLFGLSAFTAEQRTKEIGIRKVLGASDARIFAELSREFIPWVLPANFVAWPVAYVAMNGWLRNFAYRTHIGIAAFLVSGGAALLIAGLTVSFQSIKSARANPVKSLRYN
jgi:putative ABC transport system permease protein